MPLVQERAPHPGRLGPPGHEVQALRAGVPGPNEDRGRCTGRPPAAARRGPGQPGPHHHPRIRGHWPGAVGSAQHAAAARRTAWPAWLSVSTGACLYDGRAARHRRVHVDRRHVPRRACCLRNLRRLRQGGPSFGRRAARRAGGPPPHRPPAGPTGARGELGAPAVPLRAAVRPRPDAGRHLPPALRPDPGRAGPRPDGAGPERRRYQRRGVLWTSNR